MVANAIQRTVAFDREATFSDQSAKNWDSLSANGGLLYCHDLTPDDVQQGVIANKSLKPRAADSHAPVRTLRNTPHGLSFYWGSNGATAAEAAQAARVLQDDLFLVALGGEQRTFAAGIAAGTAANPTVDDAHGDNLEPYSFGFFFDTSAGVGWFRQIASVAEGVGSDTLTMATGHTLPFTPDAGGADVLNAVVEHYFDWDALEDHTHASHITLTWFRKGRQADDNLELKGCRHTIEFVPMEAGMPIEFKLEGIADIFTKENVSQPALTGTPVGGPGRIVGSGVTTLMQWAAVGADLASATFWGSVAPVLGVKIDPVPAPGGIEGLAGFGITEDSYDGTTLEITVPFLDDYAAEFRAGTERHMIMQFGTAQSGSRMAYFPRLSYAEEPKRVSVGGRAGSLLKFICRERDVAQGSLTAAEWMRARSKMTIARTA